MVTHLFLPARGPLATAAYAHLRHIWRAGREHLGLERAIAPLGLAYGLDLPADPGDLPRSGLLAGQETSGPDIVQAVLRRTNDVLWLAVALGRSRDNGAGWRELDRAWSDVVGGRSPLIIGSSRLYLAVRADPAPAAGTGSASTTALAEVCAGLLPSGPTTPGWERSGIVTGTGTAVWEVNQAADDRAERRIVLVGPVGGEAALSGWVWSSGDSTPGRFGQYLRHAAAVRYQLRVWQEDQRFREVRARVDEWAASLIDLLPDDDPSTDNLVTDDLVTDDLVTDDSASNDVASDHLAEVAAARDRLLRGETRLTAVSTALGEMQRAVEIAQSNMSKVLHDEVGPPPRRPSSEHRSPGQPPRDQPSRGQAALDQASRGQTWPGPPTDSQLSGGRDLFADDRLLADWFVQQLDDDRVFLDATRERAWKVGSLADAYLRRWTDEPAVSVDIVLLPADRTSLLHALAEVYYTDEKAEPILTEIGLNRSVRYRIAGSNSITAWIETFTALDSGVVDEPYRRLLTSALRWMPFNPTFRRLARKYRVGER